MTAVSKLQAQDVCVQFSKKPVLENLSLDIPDKALTVIVGPNGSGKSTLLRSLARLQKINSGTIFFDGKSIHRQKSRAIARQLAVLPQGLTAPEGILVRELVARGRTPHQTPLKQWSAKDEEAVHAALAKTGLEAHAQRPVTSLSGGQQQRVWIAMVLAQQTDVLLLDEPTTYLDLPHQIELLKFIKGLSVEAGATIVTVLHDINLAARFADHIVALKDGEVCVQGAPDELITEKNMQDVFAMECQVISDPIHNKPYVIPA